MGKRILFICTLVMALALQSITVSCADNQTLMGEKIPAVISAAETGQPDKLSQDELNKLKDQLSKEQEQLKKDQDQLKAEQLQLNKDKDQLKKEQEQLKQEQEQLIKDREKLDAQIKRNKLTSELTSSTYMKYIKQLGYYKSTSKDETLNIRNTLLLFQSDHNMNLSGTWDNATKEMLINRLVSKELTYADKITSAPTTGKWITVNKTKRILTLYEGTKVIKKYPVAVGNPHTLTKSGKYIIENKIINPDWGGGGFADPIKGGTPENPLGSRWMGINRTDGSYGIHGTNSFYSIGKFISHGCIRMQNYMVEELFPLVPVKAPVWVGTQKELKDWGVTQDEFTANN